MCSAAQALLNQGKQQGKMEEREKNKRAISEMKKTLLEYGLDEGAAEKLINDLQHSVDKDAD